MRVDHRYACFAIHHLRYLAFFIPKLSERGEVVPAVFRQLEGSTIE